MWTWRLCYSILLFNKVWTSLSQLSINYQHKWLIHIFLVLRYNWVKIALSRVQHLFAVDLAKEQKLNYGDEMTSILRQARKRCFQLREEQRIAQDIELQSYLNQLIVEDAERSIAALKEQEATIETNGKTEGEAASDTFTRKKEEVEEKRDTCMARLNDLFEKVDERRRKREVPDYLCGKISFEILQEPVITPSGITYERKDIEEHLQRVGHFDPVTRVRLTQDQLIPNLAMKEVVDTFLQENEWALYY
nr:STIP1 homology and U box-containing protein 1 isoform X2 [Nomia melanderi]